MQLLIANAPCAPVAPAVARRLGDTLHAPCVCATHHASRKEGFWLSAAFSATSVPVDVTVVCSRPALNRALLSPVAVPFLGASLEEEDAFGCVVPRRRALQE